MEIKTCEQYVLNELEKTQHELEKVKEEFEEFRQKAMELGIVVVRESNASDGDYYLELRSKDE